MIQLELMNSKSEISNNEQIHEELIDLLQFWHSSRFFQPPQCSQLREWKIRKQRTRALTEGGKVQQLLDHLLPPKTVPASWKTIERACYPEHAPPTHQMDTDQCHQLISWSPPQALAHLTCPPLVKPSLAFLTSSQWTITFFLVLFFFSAIFSRLVNSVRFFFSHILQRKNDDWLTENVAHWVNTKANLYTVSLSVHANHKCNFINFLCMLWLLPFMST